MTLSVSKCVHLLTGNMKRNTFFTTLIQPWRHMDAGCVANVSEKLASSLFRANTLKIEAAGSP
jgi:hypothetical protein